MRVPLQFIVAHTASREAVFGTLFKRQSVPTPSLIFRIQYEVPGFLNDISINALPDSGSAVDALSENFARQHGLAIRFANTRSIRLPGGHTNRPCIQNGSRLFLLNESPNDRLRCTINGCHASAFPDTASELMVVSGDFARRNAFVMHREEKYRRQVELIDGSTIRTDGMVLNAKLQFDALPASAWLDSEEYFKRIKIKVAPTQSSSTRGDAWEIEETRGNQARLWIATLPEPQRSIEEMSEN
ncbi:hypothetical protein Daesc_007920 [Daldinia eschscholtzii]|uniref:Uncharacterized protein n=1 Tax=Daldinia eschscholtzii TaxID=292717 RepID=A0AAX6MFK3_9PEZI